MSLGKCTMDMTGSCMNHLRLPEIWMSYIELAIIQGNISPTSFFFFFRYIIIQSQILLLLIFLFGSQLSYFHSRNFFLTHVLLNLLSPFINSCPVTSGKSFFSLLTFFISPINPKTAMLRLVAKREYSKYS